MILILLREILSPNAKAQITLDGTFGDPAAISGPDYLIKDTMGLRMGPNLFHSFGEFNLNMGESATFTGPENVENILSRVTGGNASWIDGVITTTIPGADLFFINPSGVMFGPNACLDVSGSFYVSTADYIRLGEKGRFDCTHPGKSILSVDQPSAFGFLDKSPEGIDIDASFLEVPAGEALSLLGGEIRMNECILYTENGRINIASVSSDGESSVSESGVDVGPFSSLGDIRIYEDSYIAVAGEGEGDIILQGERLLMENSCISAISEGGEGAGGIHIDVREDLLITEGGEITSYGIETGKGGPIDIEANQLKLDYEGSINSACSGIAVSGDIRISAGESLNMSGGEDYPSGIYMWTEGGGDAGRLSISASDLILSDDAIISGQTYGEGKGPDVSIDADNLELTDGGNIDSSCYAEGKGGDVTIRVSGPINISGYGEYKSGIYAQAHGSGDAGSIYIEGGGLEIINEGVITGETYEYADGRGADISIDVEDLFMARGGEISVNSYGPGQGGDLWISAGDAIHISGYGEYSGSGIGAESHGSGNAGTISISTPELIMEDEGRISGITRAEGSGGDIILEVKRLEIRDSMISSSSLEGASGDGGDITVSAMESVEISHPIDDATSAAGLFSMTGGKGSAGNIALASPCLSIGSGGEISASTAFGEGDAGDIILDVGRLDISEMGVISTSSTEGTGHAGDVRITAWDTILISGGRVSALTSAAGDAGRIDIAAPGMVVTQGGTIETLTGEGSKGYAGDIILDIGNLEVTDGGMINSSSLGFGPGGDIRVSASEGIWISDSDAENPYPGIYSLTSSSGDAGNIWIKTPFMEMAGAGACIMASTLDSGLGGGIQIFSDIILMSDRANITADSSGLGNAGNILLSAEDTLDCVNSTVTTEADSADGGNIMIRAGRMVDLKNSSITATVKGGAGDGGNIEIDPLFVILDRSEIIANAEEGKGGNIQIMSCVFLSSTDSIVSASSRLGIDGTVEINSLVTDVARHLVFSPGSFQDIGVFLPKQCVRRGEDETNHFEIRGLIGIPPSPDHLLRSP